MKNILKNKLLIVLFVFIMLIFILCNNCFAVDVTINDISTTLSDNIVSYKNYVIFTYKWNYDNKSHITVLATNGDFTFSSSNGEFNNVFYAESTDKIYGYDCLVDDYYSLSSCVLAEYLGFYDMSRTSLTNCNYVYSTCDIVDSFDNSLVFQGAPQVAATQLSQIVEQAEPKKVMAEVLGILPLILITIVGLIGLRKALSFLQKLLRKS